MIQRTIQFEPRQETRQQRLQRVLAGSDLLRLASELPARMFTEAVAERLTRLHEAEAKAGATR